MNSSRTSCTSTASSRWFFISVQALVILSQSGCVCSSQMLAERMHVHPVFMRRILAQLVRAQLIAVREGCGGGYKLTCPAAEISLAAVYRAVAIDTPLFLRSLSPRDSCPETDISLVVVASVLKKAESAMLAVLEQHTIGALLSSAAAP